MMDRTAAARTAATPASIQWVRGLSFKTRYASANAAASAARQEGHTAWMTETWMATKTAAPPAPAAARISSTRPRQAVRVELRPNAAATQTTPTAATG